MPDIQRHHFPEIDSTNTYAKQLANEGAPSFTLVTSELQTVGRGRHGRVWQSVSGNLYWSVLVRAEPGWPPLSGLSLVAGASVLRLAEQLLPEQVDIRLKWPNDVLIGGRKVSGILLEAGGSQQAPWCVIGIGLNVQGAPKTDVRVAATSLVEEGAKIDFEGACSALIKAFEGELALYLEQGVDGVCERLTQKLAGLGETVTLRPTANSEDEVTGTLLGFSEGGAALIETASGERLSLIAGDLTVGP